MKYSILLLLILLLACGNKGYLATNLKSTNDINTFCEYLQGEYSSEAQSKKDTSYFNISLVIHPIWKERIDGYWFYVEQAMSAKREKPYRQRVYQIKKGNLDTIISVIYTFENPLDYAGLYKVDSKMAKLSFDKISAKDGCEVYMKPQSNGSYKGGTKGNNCPSNLRGATYTTTEVTLLRNQLLSWDRGFDKDGKYVWGAEKGGYVFDKLK